MKVARSMPCLAVLMDGRVLVVGGDGEESAEVFDPATEQWTLIAPTANHRSRCDAVTLRDGRALVTGGQDGIYPEGYYSIHDAELYDPVTNSWSTVSSMLGGRFAHRSLSLTDGSVLVVGTLGQDRPNPEETIASEIYDLALDRWTAVPFPLSGDALRGPEAVINGIGEVIVETYNLPQALAWTVDRSWVVRGSPPGQTGSGLFVLPNGDLMIPGAVKGRTTAFADPTASHWRTGADFEFARGDAATIQLPSGDVLAVGGFSNEALYEGKLIANAELFRVKTRRWESAGRLSVPSDRYRLAALDSNRVIALSGRANYNATGAVAEVLDVRDVTAGCARESAE